MDYDNGYRITTSEFSNRVISRMRSSRGQHPQKHKVWSPKDILQKNVLGVIVTEDPVAAGKRQEANSRSSVRPNRSSKLFEKVCELVVSESQQQKKYENYNWETGVLYPPAEFLPSEFENGLFVANREDFAKSGSRIDRRRLQKWYMAPCRNRASMSSATGIDHR